MNFGEIVNASIAQVVSLTQTDQLVNTNEAFVKAMVNKGYHTIEKAAMWKFSEREATVTAVAGEREAPDLPSDVAVPLMVYGDSGMPLDFFDDRQRVFPPGDKGRVRAYGVWGGELRWFPLPSQAESFTLRYYGTWPDLVEDDDEPVIPATYHDMLMDFASYQLALRIPATGDRFLTYSRAEPYMQSFQANLAQMLDSPMVDKTWDEVPNYDFHENVLGLGDW